MSRLRNRGSGYERDRSRTDQLRTSGPRADEGRAEKTPHYLMLIECAGQGIACVRPQWLRLIDFALHLLLFRDAFVNVCPACGPD
jgi:hypothetical protein